MTSEDVLRKAFAVANEVEQDNLRFHLERGTRILCGEDAYLYTDEDGAG
jgi:threonine aldolase